MTYIHFLFQNFFWSIRLIKEDPQEKLFQKLALRRLPQSFCDDQTFDQIEWL